jgi:hypothetical protein
METPGNGHGRNVVENFLYGTHFGHPSPRPYMPIAGPPPIGGDGQHASGGGGTAPLGGVGRGAELE